MTSYHALSKEFVTMLCGGKLPEVAGHNWDIVKQFRLDGNRIIPYSDGVAIGPDLKIVAIPNQNNTDTTLIEAIE